MDKKLEHLNSLPIKELNFLKREWQKVLHKFPDYRLAKEEINLLSKILSTK